MLPALCHSVLWGARNAALQNALSWRQKIVAKGRILSPPTLFFPPFLFVLRFAFQSYFISRWYSLLGSAALYAFPMAPYKYVPLGKCQIRLLELHEASSHDGDLQGTIHIMTLPEERELGSHPSPAEINIASPATISVEYSALSHHWGPRGDTSSIKIITNSLTPHEITIRRNLEPALRQLRSKIRADDEASRYYWIDAICINQKDPDDKDKQIPMMAHIYNGAKRVCVWLGDEFSWRPYGVRREQTCASEKRYLSNETGQVNF
jgi:Heterokaryon incompatibility protein (HET)